MKIISYNVNGIRAAVKKGLIDWVKATNADVVCLQEVKALPEQIDVTPFEEMGYRLYWMPAEKKGYSGVMTMSRIEPKYVHYGCGMEIYDTEGRVLILDFDDFSIMNTYMPSGSSGELRQEFKMQWLADFYEYIKTLKEENPKMIICGDYNICHKPIDIHNPVSNKKSSGFLPEEREWITKFIELGFIDTFRHFNEEPHNYTWWSYRSGARERNLGWRIDYHMVSEALRSRLKRAGILPQAKHSDHCPLFVELDY